MTARRLRFFLAVIRPGPSRHRAAVLNGYARDARQARSIIRREFPGSSVRAIHWPPCSRVFVARVWSIE
jgi:hypothetical protein